MIIHRLQIGLHSGERIKVFQLEHFYKIMPIFTGSDAEPHVHGQQNKEGGDRLCTIARTDFPGGGDH